MPIKGKKKPRSRGSQARRRPAAAPSPAVGAVRRRTAWYQTPLGRMIAAIAGVIVLGLAIAWFVDYRSKAEDAAARRTELDSYTAQVRSLLTALGPVANEMARAPTTTEGADLKQLRNDADGWAQSLGDAQAQASSLTPPPGLEGASDVYRQSVAEYLSSANTFAMVAQADGDLAELILLRAIEQRDRGTALFQAANQTLDSERDDAGMDPAGLTAPILQTQQQGAPPGTETGEEEGAGDGAGEGEG